MIVDTNILIDFLRGKTEAGAFLFGGDNPISISVVSITELLAGIKQQREIDDIHDLLTTFTVHPLTREIAEKAGELLNVYDKSHHIGIADALIAATSVYHSEPLSTLNVKDFPMLSDVSKPY